ncbi:MAG: ribosome maturation factor RimP [Rhodospirillaceae bacterium]|nr:ribosome maturation factor RimP [Rhodospirillaceae bacterium]|tara:strand:- start:1157 stop:1726 length:570 start_codon:yes stop_codon:yes gene_type:complete
MNIDLNEIFGIIKPEVESNNFRLVRVNMFGNGKATTLQIMIEHKDAYLSLIPGDGGINANDCANVSHTISPVLEKIDFLQNNYNLEVSSPGIDRPLTSNKDFDRFMGFEIKVEFFKKYLEKKQVRGKLIFTNESKIKIDNSKEVLEIDRKNIRKAKLILTSELIEASKNANKRFNQLKKESFCHGKTDG